jgi:hypothetical protein
MGLPFERLSLRLWRPFSRRDNPTIVSESLEARLNTALAYRMMRRWACNCLTMKIGSTDISRAFRIEHPGVFTTWDFRREVRARIRRLEFAVRERRLLYG